MKKSKLMLGLLMAVGFSGVASAHEYAGAITAPITKTTDKFYITCAAGTTSMKYHVKRTAGGPSNLALCPLSSSGCTVANTTTSGGTGVYSALKTVTAGAGAFHFQVKKSPVAAGAVGYMVEAHCMEGNTHYPNDQSTTVTYTVNQ